MRVDVGLARWNVKGGGARVDLRRRIHIRVLLLCVDDSLRRESGRRQHRPGCCRGDERRAFLLVRSRVWRGKDRRQVQRLQRVRPAEQAVARNDGRRLVGHLRRLVHVVLLVVMWLLVLVLPLLLLLLLVLLSWSRLERAKGRASTGARVGAQRQWRAHDTSEHVGFDRLTHLLIGEQRHVGRAVRVWRRREEQKIEAQGGRSLAGRRRRGEGGRGAWG